MNEELYIILSKKNLSLIMNTNQEKKSNKTIWIGLLAALLLGSNAYWLFNSSQKLCRTPFALITVLYKVTLKGILRQRKPFLFNKLYRLTYAFLVG